MHCYMYIFNNECLVTCNLLSSMLALILTLIFLSCRTYLINTQLIDVKSLYGYTGEQQPLQWHRSVLQIINYCFNLNFLKIFLQNLIWATTAALIKTPFTPPPVIVPTCFFKQTIKCLALSQMFPLPLVLHHKSWFHPHFRYCLVKGQTKWLLQFQL